MRDTEWASQNCSISFRTIGIWSETNDGTDINSVGRNTASTMLATGDDSGRVKIYVYPTCQPKVSTIKFKTKPILYITIFFVIQICIGIFSFFI